MDEQLDLSTDMTSHPEGSADMVESNTTATGADSKETLPQQAPIDAELPVEVAAGPYEGGVAWPPTAPSRPQLPRVRPEAIPAELRALQQWVLWRYDWKEGRDGKPGRWAKVLYRAAIPRVPAKSDDPETWSTFADTWEAYEAGQTWSGIGFVFAPGDGLAGVDLDDCVDEGGALKPWAREIVDRLGGYAEVSPSGTGVKVFCRGAVPEGRGRRKPFEDGEVEVYDRGRYFTVTGAVLAGHAAITGDGEGLATLHAELFPPPPPRERGAGRAGDDPCRERDVQVILEAAENAANGDEFLEVWNDEDELGQSEGDWSLLSRLAWWTDCDAGLMEDLASRSPRARNKWDEPRGDETWLQYQINNMIESYRAEGRTTRGWGKARATRSSDEGAEEMGEAELDTSIQKGELFVDAGQAMRVARLYRDRIRYDSGRKIWYGWDGRRWVRDADTLARRCVQSAAFSLLDEAGRCPAGEEGEKRAAAIAKWARTCLSAKGIDAVLKVARIHPDLEISSKDLDRSRTTLNFQNGTLDLETGELRPHDPADLNTRLAPHDYDREAECPNTMRQLRWSCGGRLDEFEFLQRALGYSISGDTREHAFFCVYGEGLNGKSLMLELVGDALGEYAAAADPSMLTVAHGEVHPTELTQLDNRHYVYMDETDDGKRFAEARLKNLTGGKKYSARGMRENFSERDMTAHLWMGTNYRPAITGTDKGIWRRMYFIHFAQTILEEKVDTRLEGILRAEIPGFLAWLVRGYQAWRQFGLAPPASVRRNRDDYRAEQDVVGRFLLEETEAGDGVSYDAVYWRYGEWVKDQGKTGTLSKIKFNKRVKEKGVKEGRTTHARGWAGIALKARAADPDGGFRHLTALEAAKEESDRRVMQAFHARAGGDGAAFGAEEPAKGKPARAPSEGGMVTREEFAARMASLPPSPDPSKPRVLTPAQFAFVLGGDLLSAEEFNAIRPPRK